MSESDSFLSEVSEEVRRDQLTAALKKYAVWIIAGVVIIVGAAAFLEWQKASQRAAAEARGDALWAALTSAEGEARLTALEGLEMQGPDGQALLQFQRAAVQLTADADGEATTEAKSDAVTALQQIAANGDVSDPLRNVARLKIVGISAGILSAQEREDLLIPMLENGHAMRALALEARAILNLEAGNIDAAVADLQEIGNDGSAPAQARARAEQLLDILAPDAADDETANG